MCAAGEKSAANLRVRRFREAISVQRRVRKLKIAVMISTIITVLVAASTLICGLWIRANNVTDPSSIDFHKTIGIATVVCIIITAILVFTLLLDKH